MFFFNGTATTEIYTSFPTRRSSDLTYEFRVHSDTGNINGSGPTQRLTIVGIKGDWGQLSLGSQWSTLFNTVGTFIDKSKRYGGLGYYTSGGQGRMSESVYLSTNLGGFSVSADAQMNADGDEDDLDRATIGTNINIGGVGIGAAWQDNGNDDFTGIGASIAMAGV